MKKFKYSKEKSKRSLKMGGIIITIGIFFVLLHQITGELKNISFRSLGVFQMIFGITVLLLNRYENKKQYLTLTNEELINNSLFGKKIELSEITSIKEFGKDLILKTAKGEFVINTEIMDEESLLELKEELEKYK